MQTDFGILQLSTSAPPEAALTWSEQPVHGVLIVLSVAAILLWLPDIIRLMPLLLECVSRVRPNLMLEHSLHQARTRNLAAVLVLVPFCLMADRYGLYRPGFIENLAPGWHVPGLVGIAAAWILLKSPLPSRATVIICCLFLRLNLIDILSNISELRQ